MQELESSLLAARLNARYGRSLDAGFLDEWPQYFTEDALYRVTTRDNFLGGLPGSLIYARGKAMLLDRVQALQRANIYEVQSYRHVIGTPLLENMVDQTLKGETPFLVLRIMRTGETSIFASGSYVDRIAVRSDGQMLLSERQVICDSSRIDTLLAIPL